MEMIGVFWLSLIVFGLTIVHTSACDVNLLLTQDALLGKSIFAKYQKSDISSCASQCQSHKICKSFSFNTEKKVCYLNFNSSEDVGELVSRSGFVYSDISEWPQMSGACSFHTCNKRKHCQVLRNSSTKCYFIPFADIEHGSTPYYNIRNTFLAFDAAQERCIDTGGSLVIINSETEHRFFSNVLSVVGWTTANIWIGMIYETNTTTWRWLDGTPVIWKPPDLDLDVSKACVAMNEGRWVSRNCTCTFKSICEFQI